MALYKPVYYYYYYYYACLLQLVLRVLLLYTGVLSSCQLG